MELEANERSIFGYFPSSTKAEAAMEELERAGMVPGEGYMQIDRVSRFGVVDDAEYNNPINNAITLHGPTIYSNSQGVDDGANPLLAVNASGMDRGFNNDDMPGSRSFMVVLVTTEDKVDQAVQIMKANDAQV